MQGGARAGNPYPARRGFQPHRRGQPLFQQIGRYPETGAWQEATGNGYSPYGSWYGFHRQGDQLFYDSWWGFPDLPSVNEHDLTYREKITGPDGIARHWLRLGASGWRLDVSDELPDGFLRELRLAVRAERDDAVLLGEVWEDASNKISYGSYRDFLFGRTHDHVMGYPFQQALIGFLSGQFAAERMHHLLETLREHYPPAAQAASFNLIGSHDTMRALTALAGPPDPGSREIQARVFLTPEQRAHGEALLRLAVLFQMTSPGCPVIYYGDETAMEGYRDPFNGEPSPGAGKTGRCRTGSPPWAACAGNGRCFSAGTGRSCTRTATASSCAAASMKTWRMPVSPAMSWLPSTAAARRAVSNWTAAQSA
jgi:4-alpha-glucanotransferase